ncbi:hypothetical protein Lal_00034681 [Lupinus albus]|uniref:Uncharacterized protein n=1 Tax=Lupinus albus TaxID=3870 RepID=A0A6A4QQQ4_LUPAL|nr:hypothetical protein Lalb_Chr03g0027141 [Lupinus albus]KAF1896980.1 hypothetical protein Lal_00034681 [Lupinus albus]
MQSMLNLRANHGIPLCLSGITNPLSLSKEIADHDRRRKDMMRKQRSLAREGVHANQEFIVIKKGGDLDDILNDLSLAHLDFTAKTA